MKPRFKFDFSKMTLSNGNAPTATTLGIYKAALNRVAADGFTTKDDLLKKQSDCVKAIETRIPEKQKRRVTLSAIFRVLSDVANEDKKLYYEAFQKAKG